MRPKSDAGIVRFADWGGNTILEVDNLHFLAAEFSSLREILKIRTEACF